MSDSWGDRRRVLEDEFIERQNKEALEKLAHHGQPSLLSPITGQPMVRAEVLGIAVDRCPESGGVWLDKGELEELLNRARHETGSDETGTGGLGAWLQELWGVVTGK